MCRDRKDIINDTADKLKGTYKQRQLSNLPKKSEVVELLGQIKRLLFPEGFEDGEIEVKGILENVGKKLYEQINLALAFEYVGEDAHEINTKADRCVKRFVEHLPRIREMLCMDVEAQFLGDPAAGSKEEVVLAYPGIYAIFIYRIAHELYKLSVPFIPRMMTEYAHEKTGIDIHPGAKIGEHFFIDHGTGVVIGETTVIGNRVKLYQGVTLGAMSLQRGQELAGIKRHPTIEDDVTIYAGATILGGDTVIGANSVIAGNTLIVESVPANTTVSAYLPKLRFKNRREG